MNKPHPFADWFSLALKLFPVRILIGVHVRLWDRDSAGFLVLVFAWRGKETIAVECFEDLLTRVTCLARGEPPHLCWRLTWRGRTAWEHLPTYRAPA